MSSSVTITWTVIFLGAVWAPICHWSSVIEDKDNREKEDG